MRRGFLKMLSASGAAL
ncbi:twin-arginine translocation signal domain-containing protein [Sinorhizobium meliloti]